MHASVNVGCQGKSGPGKIQEVILVYLLLLMTGRQLTKPKKTALATDSFFASLNTS